MENWRNEWRNFSFRYNFIFSFLFLIATLLVCSKFLLFAESRKGFFFNDYFLSVLPNYDLSGIIFFILYSTLIIGLGHVSRFPHRLILAFYAYTIVLIFRMLSIYFFPLEAPANIIVLKDPFVEFFTGTSIAVTKDLFFSGHTATMCLLYFFVKNKWLKISFLISAIAVGLMLLIQHVHYTMDVIAAPFFAVFGCRLVILFYRNSRQMPISSWFEKLAKEK